MLRSGAVVNVAACYHLSSLAEMRAKQLIDQSPADFAEHTRHQLVRIYPKGLRTASSNYDPLPYWRAGSQIGALQNRNSTCVERHYRRLDNHGRQ